jgi:predicted metalloprotease with PDZ domain
MDIGRFVRSFEALDERGQPVATERISTNQWRIAGPTQRAADSLLDRCDAGHGGVRAHRVPMCGTTLQADHALINGQAVFGFPRGMQASPISIQLAYPAEWKSAPRCDWLNGRYRADNYDQLVDSPILLGRLTSARVDVTGVPVEIFVYSKTDQITAPQLGAAMSTMLFAAGRFLGKLPVDRYAISVRLSAPNRSARGSTRIAPSTCSTRHLSVRRSARASRTLPHTSFSTS